jgi:hypothetical protein
MSGLKVEARFYVIETFDLLPSLNKLPYGHRVVVIMPVLWAEMDGNDHAGYRIIVERFSYDVPLEPPK